MVTFTNNEALNSVLSGFTIRRGTGQSDPCGASWYWKGTDGGGVFCRNASPTITKNVFKNCRAEYGGGAIYCHDQASPLISENTFLDNYAGAYGGAIFARLNSSPTISNNIFKYNQCHYLGGAIYLADQCYSKVTGNWIQGNDCEVLHGGGIYYFVYSAPVIANNFFIENTCSGFDRNGATGAALLAEAYTTGRIINNIFTGNSCPNNSNGVVIKISNNSSDIFANNIVYENQDIGLATGSGGTPPILNNCIWNNTGGNYGGDLSDQNGINGNISADPLIGPVLPEPFGSYELHPNSPCINTGNNTAIPGWLTQDYDLTDRTVASTVDIGPQEYHTIAVPQDFNTIQEAINAALSGDEIVVSPGTYMENVSFLDKNIKLRSLDPLDPNCVAQTIIDGNGTESCIKILSGQDQSTVVAGLRCQNGHGEFGGGIHVGNSVGPILMYNYVIGNTADRYGGGIDSRNDAYAEIINNVVIDNFASDAGGGVHVGPRSSALIKNNRILYNETTGEAGGGIYAFSRTTAWIINNQIIGNRTISGNGGGIWLWDCPGGIVEGNIIVGNSAEPFISQGGTGLGGGIGMLNAVTLVQNNVICGNNADQGGGIWIQNENVGNLINNTIVGNQAEFIGAGIAVAYNVKSNIANNIIANNGSGGGLYIVPLPKSEPNLVANNLWNNLDGDYIGDINDQTGTNGNIMADPCFADPGYWADANTPDPNDDYFISGNYRIPYSSPCRDTGDANYAPITDVAGNTRPYFDAVDIGAYELQGYDMTGTGMADYTDLALLAASWLDTEGPLLMDLDQSGIVDGRDFALLAKGWMK